MCDAGKSPKSKTDDQSNVDPKSRRSNASGMERESNADPQDIQNRKAEDSDEEEFKTLAAVGQNS